MENEVTVFLKPLKHPLIKEIEFLRATILSANAEMGENIKWNGPNFHHKGADRISMRINPTIQLQLILHRGAKVLKQPKEKLIDDDSDMLVWKGYDRAVITFQNMQEIKAKEAQLKKIITKWLIASDAVK